MTNIYKNSGYPFFTPVHSKISTTIPKELKTKVCDDCLGYGVKKMKNIIKGTNNEFDGITDVEERYQFCLTCKGKGRIK